MPAGFPDKYTQLWGHTLVGEVVDDDSVLPAGITVDSPLEEAIQYALENAGGAGSGGDSAYQVAVGEGFVGDETAWLASLVGADGADGVDGTNGTQGPQGAVGATGATGAAGPGLPSGGIAGQIAVKASGTDYDTAWATGGANVLHVADHGAYTGTAADNKTALEAAMAAASDGDTICFSATQSFALDAPVTVTKQLTFTSDSSNYATLACTDGAFVVDSTDVTFRLLDATGNLDVGLDNVDSFIRSQYTGGADRLKVENCKIDGFSSSILVWLSSFLEVTGCFLTRFSYIGVQLSSCTDFMVVNNQMADSYGEGTGAGPDGLTYGVTATSPLGTAHSERGVISNNIIKNIPWTGIDSHGGRNLTISNNALLDCYQGIVLTTVTGSTVTADQCKLVTISGNVIDSAALGNNSVPLLNVSGASTTALARAITVSGNTMIGGQHALTARWCESVQIVGNSVNESHTSGIRFREIGPGCVAVGNTVIDPYGASSTAATVFWVDAVAEADAPVITGNSAARKSEGLSSGAAFVCETFVRGPGFATTFITGAGNNVSQVNGVTTTGITANPGEWT